MKKIISIFLSLILLLSLMGCGESSSDYEATDNLFEDNYGYESNDSSNEENYDYNDYTETNTDNNNNNSNNNNNNYTPSITAHTHYYSSTVTREATCGKEGLKTYKCSCGDTYTESISKKSYHNWEYATCRSPKKCKDCGKTEGTAKEHDYKEYDGYKCSMCGQVDPNVQNTLSKCSLQLPSLPKSITYYGYSNKIYSKVDVTNITYQFEYYNDGKVTLMAKFSGKKTYDYNGTGQSSSCRIGWKLYDPAGNVFRSGTFSSPNIAMGETFSNQEEDLIYNFEAASPGAYRLEILNVN